MSGIRCRNCDYSITLINYALGPAWMHQHPSAAFEDGVYEHCKTSVATPPEGAAAMSHSIADDFAEFFAESAAAADASLTADINAQIEASAPRAKRDAAPAKVSHAQALQLIADRGCAIGGTGCRHLKWLRPNNWCSPCIAANALEDPSPQVDPCALAAEVLPPDASQVDAVASGANFKASP